MNRWCVPDFEAEEEDHHLIPSSSGFHRPPNKPFKHGDDLVELLWENGQLVNKNHKSLGKKTHHNSKQPYQQPEDGYDDSGVASISGSREFHHMGPPPSQPMEQTGEAATGGHLQNHLFMEEDEMASWLHYPLFPDDNSSFRPEFGANENNNNLAYPTQFGCDYTPPQPPPPPVNRITQVLDDHRSAAPPPHALHGPPMPPPTSSSSKLHSFGHFSRTKVPRSDESQPTTPDKMKKGSTVLDSTCQTPPMWTSKSSDTVVPDKDAVVACEQMTARASSSAGSGAGTKPSKKMPTEDRKRKTRKTDEHEYQSEDGKFQSGDTKKQARGSTSARRARVAEVHNLSERRRRDRINEKMKALQELIPHCNKSDKASMLDEAIEYLKSLQLQVQMMSMGCGMVPMMFPPGIQQYMPQMGMGLSMHMGMGMDFGLNRPMMMPFTSVLAPTPAHLGQTLPVPAFHMPPPTANTGNSLRPPIFPADPYQSYLNSLHMQSQAMAQPSTSNSKGVESDNNRKPCKL